MNLATSSVSGLVAIVSGSPTCWIFASFMTTIRSAIDRDSSWLCVTWMNISPSSRWRFRSSTRMRSWSNRSRSPSGSSRSSALGWVTSTRARATRCCWPTGELARLAVGKRFEADHLEGGHRAASAARPCRRRASSARTRRSGAPCGAGRARSAERPSSSAACAAAGRRATPRRAGCGRSSGTRGRRSSAASSSSRTPRDRAGRRTRRGRRAGRSRRRPPCRPGRPSSRR